MARTPAIAAAERAGIPHRAHADPHDPKAFETVFVSAGRRGLELELSPADLVRLAGARVAAVACRG